MTFLERELKTIKKASQAKTGSVPKQKLRTHPL